MRLEKLTGRGAGVLRPAPVAAPLVASGRDPGDEKSSTDAVGAARQYSGALGGVGLCQVAVHLTYASSAGNALIDRTLYVTRDSAADDERRELVGVPHELADRHQAGAAPRMAVTRTPVF
ncbi:transposase [Streptomyces sp. NPDC021086]|uniref:transposase n=1 Tax=Streptomyces sp. NPDC021086 TaxID=3365111 RepID=UPI00379C9F8E